ncbi:uncharacterized protein TrAtP1_003053 [Trichoderma atroviride]|uniref:Uncharacterized protein n=1 Tax=Hypocrea atroviridis (strain ATCC 20476 / IMI 206040) TaxID=452589 RepID=G9NV65_HYPAI|nr:uncharacterized protein TRIATDRAFT_308445 [Trichoderma atroviride IMI 206040]EHK44886.1 hypothetical protein TRIATDRAFT_308445 [Trichoderma atroviride IMI 206040]UKZ61795.1 hypothetical protein TrAtP1_003053 [Trichoderma atroviride]
MEYHSLYGFSFGSGSLLLSAEDELGLIQTEYEQWQRLFELDSEAFTPLPLPNDRYEAHQMAAAQRIGIHDDYAQDFYYQHARRISDAYEDLHQPQSADWASISDTRAESLVGVSRNEPQYLSDLPDESMRQIIYSDSYQNRLAPGLYIYRHGISPENEAGAPPVPFAGMPEDGNNAFRAMVESEEEYSNDEDTIFDVASEEESIDDQRGFEGDDEGIDDGDEDGDDEDSDSCMDLGEDEDEDSVEVDEEDGEAMHMREEVPLMRITRRSIFDQNFPTILCEEETWEVQWPSGTWQNAFNRTGQN